MIRKAAALIVRLMALGDYDRVDRIENRICDILGKHVYWEVCRLVRAFTSKWAAKK